MSNQLDDMAVFKTPDGTFFSMDPRWNDKANRDAWLKLHNRQEAEITKTAVDEDDDPDDGPDDEVPEYAEWTNDDLRAELATRNLPVDGKKEILVKRLEEDDARED
ncbi:SAP domain-containing protein [Streptomyces sp. NPDC002248]